MSDLRSYDITEFTIFETQTFKKNSEDAMRTRLLPLYCYDFLVHKCLLFIFQNLSKLSSYNSYIIISPSDQELVVKRLRGKLFSRKLLVKISLFFDDPL